MTVDGERLITQESIALLRGINVGGRNRLPMKELAAIFAEAGCEGVRTYIQSGNVVFRRNSESTDDMANVISESILSKFGYRVPVITRSASELRDIVQANPFVDSGATADKLHVVFLGGTPDGTRLNTLDPDRSPPDEFSAGTREVYLHCPQGFARTKFTNAYFDSRLETISTTRNWRTVLRLFGMTATGGLGK